VLDGVDGPGRAGFLQKLIKGQAQGPLTLGLMLEDYGEKDRADDQKQKCGPEDGQSSSLIVAMTRS
jgi:hypothetical protein